MQGSTPLYLAKYSTVLAASTKNDHKQKKEMQVPKKRCLYWQINLSK